MENLTVYKSKVLMLCGEEEVIPGTEKTFYEWVYAYEVHPFFLENQNYFEKHEQSFYTEQEVEEIIGLGKRTNFSSGTTPSHYISLWRTQKHIYSEQPVNHEEGD